MHHPLLFYVVICLAVAILGLSKGGFAGIGMLSTPLVALVMGPLSAAALMLPIMLVQDVIVVGLYRRSFCRPILWTLLPGAALGVVLAYGAAAEVPEWGVEVLLGGISVVFALYQLVVALSKSAAANSMRSGPVAGGANWFGALCGAGAGFTSSIAHAGSPPFQFYVQPLNLSRDIYIGTSVMFFALLNAMKLPAFLALGLLSPAGIKESLIFLPLAILSSWAGARLVRFVDLRHFNLMISAILLLVGSLLVGQGLLAA